MFRMLSAVPTFPFTCRDNIQEFVGMYDNNEWIFVGMSTRLFVVHSPDSIWSSSEDASHDLETVSQHVAS